MQSQAHRFKPRAVEALHNETLQQALAKAKGGFIDKRAAAIQEIPDFESLRQRGETIKEHTLAHLDVYLEQFEAQLLRQGGQVHWAEDARDATRVIADICREADAKRILKAKTMAGEEVGLNEALEEAGFEIVETDLGEYIIQLAHEPPSHIIAPAVHKTREEITRLFDRVHHGLEEVRLREVPDLVDEARQVLREKFLSAEVGISGANLLVAETGSVTVVTNEGNADLSMTQPRVHIVIAGIEKLVPTLEDAGTLLRLLGRSATGQAMTAYTSLVTGDRREEDPDGPVEYHVVLLDNGRSRMLAGKYRDMLRCIRCGACMNHCPVYGSIGGHAYGWVYPGPMGAVLTPQFVGLDEAYDLPHACTLNGRCKSVCPVRIPLPDMLRSLRDDQFEARITPARTRWALKLWGWVARRPRLYHLGARLASRLLANLGRGSIQHLPGAGGWTRGRDFPLPQGETFQQAWKRQKEHRGER
ncbi:LutB/LldF family L-lactate oxidation iron-sulfur protein [Alkalilimnicola sp. S0819]|uniref:LutB/LldF family L-lactate oxidation iron-sulfur protein n=1 Tax=Alkalilimnicola sp. S0819 TaxID=2613922 RepID=UPI0012616FEC|nr:LutB/LldF family L-lactate oxidation iron-sulfur protein [Alkalilimnicola sp. S0819]KAB7619574.1 iron-sulfur cluster-binding protein [Alkalilimnicola sp. S0819]MPQ17626.1 iron-sulfur cluster-binding protein [Alkalilimnicola sp. S0819]